MAYSVANPYTLPHISKHPKQSGPWLGLLKREPPCFHIALSCLLLLAGAYPQSRFPPANREPVTVTQASAKENQTPEGSKSWRGSAVWPLLALICTMFFWATTTIIVRSTHGEIPPMGLGFWRNFIAFLIILPFGFAAAWRQWDLIRANIWFLTLMAALLWVGGNALLFIALQYTIAINAGVINSVEPIFIIIAAAVLFRERISGQQGLGIALSMLGVLVLIAHGSPARLLELKFNIGDLIVTIAYVFWSLYAVLLRKMPRGLDPLAMLLVLAGLGALLLLPIYIIETLLVRPMPVSLTSVSAIGSLALFSCALAMFLWNYSITTMGAVRAGQYLHLIPAFTVILAIAVLGEQMGLYHLAGIALIVAGLVVTARG